MDQKIPVSQRFIAVDWVLLTSAEYTDRKKINFWSVNRVAQKKKKERQSLEIAFTGEILF